MSSDNTPVLEIQASAGTPVELQSGEFVANAAFHRDGADLLLTSPAGETVIIRDYFAQNPPPDIDTADGAHLSPEMVDAFLPPQHIGEYAANTVTANDASPAGQVTETIGDATIVRADGTRVPAEIGTPIYPGDVIETSADGAVNLLFIDNTTFALSENARLSIDEYIYNTADQSGSTLFSMMQGVFVYTSGLVGKNDPGSVNIETPVGSIGIRGTVVAGDINPAGEDSTITIIDGAIVLNNGGGTLELSNSFETAVLSSYQTAPDNIGQISAQSFMQTYNAVSGVAPSTFEAVSGAATTGGDTAAPEATTAPETQTAPEAPVAPVTENQPTTEGTAGETTGTVETAPAQETALPPPPPPPGTETILMPPPPPPGETTTFTGTTTTFGTTTNPFLPPPPPPGGTVTFLPPPPPPPPSGDTTLSGATNTNPPPDPFLDFIWSSKYLNGTPLFQGDDGIRLLGTNWNIGDTVAFANLKNFVGAHHFELSYTINGNASYLATSGNVIGNGYVGPNSGTPNPHDMMSSGGEVLFSFNSSTGSITLVNPLAMNAAINNNIQFKILAVDGMGQTIASTPLTDGHVLTDTASAVLIGTAGPETDLYGSHISLPGIAAGPRAIFAGDGYDQIYGVSTGDIVMAGDGEDKIKIANSNFMFIDGGTNPSPSLGDTLSIGDYGTMNIDFTAVADGKIKNIEYLSLGNGSTVTLNLDDIFAMTDANHMLTIQATPGTTGYLNLVQTGLNPLPGGTDLSVAGTNSALTLTGTASNGVAVTLVINQGTSVDGVQTLLV